MRQVVPDIYVVEGLRTSHVYLLTSEGGFALVDSGSPGEAEQIVAEIEGAGFALSDLRIIVLTHCHSDHAGSVAELARRSGAQVLAHQDEVPYIEQTESLPFRSLPQRILWWFFDRLFKVPPCQVSRAVRDGEVIEALGGLQVIHAPGHTPGSIALYQPERRVLFCGDVLFNQSVMGGREGVQFPPRIASVDQARAQASARELAALPVEVACFGHGKPILEGAGEKLRRALG